MLKQLFFPLLLTLAAIPALAAGDPTVPMFVDVEVQIADHGKQIYLAEVLIPSNQRVVDNSLRTVTAPYTCPPGHPVLTPPTYQEGIHLVVFGQSEPNNQASIGANFKVAIPRRNGEVALGVACKQEGIKTNTYESWDKGTTVLKNGESHDYFEGDVLVNVSLKGIYVSPPEGREPGRFYRY